MDSVHTEPTDSHTNTERTGKFNLRCIALACPHNEAVTSASDRFVFASVDCRRVEPKAEQFFSPMIVCYNYRTWNNCIEPHLQRWPFRHIPVSRLLFITLHSAMQFASNGLCAHSWHFALVHRSQLEHRTLNINFREREKGLERLRDVAITANLRKYRFRCNTKTSTAKQQSFNTHFVTGSV